MYPTCPRTSFSEQAHLPMLQISGLKYRLIELSVSLSSRSDADVVALQAGSPAAVWALMRVQQSSHVREKVQAL